MGTQYAFIWPFSPRAVGIRYNRVKLYAIYCYKIGTFHMNSRP